MEKVLSPRFMIGFDVLLLATQLDSYDEKDPRNERASKLIKKAGTIYISGGQRYIDMLNDVGENAFMEYYNWYEKNITNVVRDAQEFIQPDYEDGVPKYDVTKYGIAKYFDGLNKEVFEEIQKLIMFLYDKKSLVALNSLQEEFGGDEDFTEHTHGFVILAHSILIACLEGGEFLDRLERICFRYHLEGEEDIDSITKMYEEFKESRILGIDQIADNFINRNYTD